MTEQELMYASEEDIAFFHKCTIGLPSAAGFSGTGFDASGNRIPFGCGPHSVRCLREIVDFVKPSGIIEVGLNCGWSSSMWLELAPNAKVLSIDISDKAETMEAGSILLHRYSPRFEFMICDSAKAFEKWPSTLESVNADLIFIDGGHLEHHVMADIKLALDLKIKWLAFDDILEQFGPGVLPAIAKYPELEEVKTLGNIALYKNTSI
ncbi:MAG TPA: class I SAM-dependent methyltransferase [Cyclobacteriaceae bacterium]|jgi:cephalosporin hydroxylase|nr:class I SAM-dependent methyltransferase [Cyclobacteriaceae bacterium]